MGVGYLASKRNLAFLALLLLAITFSAPSFAVAESGVTIWRLSNPYTGEHLFTTKKSEYDQRASEGWKAEGTGWEAPTSGDPVYRLYNPYTGEHHYTQSQQESKSLQDLGWTYMGTVDQPPQSSGSGSDQNLSVKVYKVHHPGTNGYVYTTDEGILPGFLDGGRWMLEGVYDSWDEVVFTPGAKYGVRTPDHKTYIYLDDENEWKTNLQLGCEDVGPGKGWA